MPRQITEAVAQELRDLTDLGTSSTMTFPPFLAPMPFTPPDMEKIKVNHPQKAYRTSYIFLYELSHLKTRSDSVLSSLHIYSEENIFTDCCSRSFLKAFGYKH